MFPFFFLNGPTTLLVTTITYIYNSVLTSLPIIAMAGTVSNHGTCPSKPTSKGLVHSKTKAVATISWIHKEIILKIQAGSGTSSIPTNKKIPYQPRDPKMHQMKYPVSSAKHYSQENMVIQMHKSIVSH